MTNLFLQCALLVFLYASLWYLIALYKKRNDVADIAWGLGYILLCMYVHFTQPFSPLSDILMVLVTLWGLRLSIHIFLRNRNQAEDYRYRQWREAWGRNFYWRSYLQVFILQGCILVIVASPLLLAAHRAEQQLSLFTWAGVCCWLVGFFFQTVGDYQLSVFRKSRKSRDEIMQTGLWKYSRHPNYFGEMMMWWGIYITILPLPGSGWFIVSPLLITYLLLNVSGIPLLEKKYRGNAAFEAYQKRTSALFPLPPRKEIRT